VICQPPAANPPFGPPSGPRCLLSLSLSLSLSFIREVSPLDVSTEPVIAILRLSSWGLCACSSFTGLER
jgi:hypothetical protein